MYTTALLDDIKNRELKTPLHARIAKVLPVIMAAGIAISSLGALKAQDLPKQSGVTQVVAEPQRNLYSDPNLAHYVQGITESTYLGKTRDGKITRVVTDIEGRSFLMFGLLNPNEAPIPGEPFQTPSGLELEQMQLHSNNLPQPLTNAEVQHLIAHPEAHSLVESDNQVKLNSQIYNVSRQKAFDDMAVTFTYLCGKHSTPKGIINLGERRNDLSKLGWRVDYKTGEPTLKKQPPVLEQLGEAISDMFGM